MADAFTELLAKAQTRPGARDDLLRALMIFVLNNLDANQASDGDEKPELGTMPPVDASFASPEIRVKPHFQPSPS